MKNFRQGKYEVVNKDKYKGDPNKVRYLSSYELAFFQWCDRSPSVIAWNSEEVIVPYYNEVKGRQARYMVDVYIKYRDKNGNIHEELIEIKPSAQTKKPKKGRKRKDVFENEVLTWIQNNNKWEAAQDYAKQRNMKFRIVTEQSIFKG